MENSAKQLLRCIALTRISQMTPHIPDPLQSPIKGALIELTQPSIYMIMLISALDEALEDYIEEKGILWPNKTKRNLFNRINVVLFSGVNIESELLHKLRECRNKIAHEAEPNYIESFKWKDLDQAIEIALNTFITLGFFSNRPNIKAYSKREPIFYAELGPKGERVKHKHIIGATLDETPFVEFSYEISYKAAGF